MIFGKKNLNALLAIVICVTLIQTVILILTFRPDNILFSIFVFTAIVLPVSAAGVYIFYYFNGDRWSPRLVFLTGFSITTAVWLFFALFDYFYYGTFTYAEYLLRYSYKTYMVGAFVTAIVYFWLKTNYQHSKILSKKEKEIRRIVQEYETYLKDKKEALQQQGGDAEKTLKQNDAVEKLLYDFQQLLESEKIYRRQGLDIDTAAKMLNSNRNYLSRAINQTKQQNFVEYINLYRVEEAVEIIREQSRGGNNYTIQAISEMAGFNNRTSFYAAFKQVVGVTPMEYKKTINE